MTTETIATLLTALDTELRSCRSATKVLEEWCGCPVSASRSHRGVKPLPDGWSGYLRLASCEHLGYRHVELMAGDLVLSQADNWYVPDRLTAAMNDLLERENTPFGKVIAPLRPYRSILSRRVLWQGTSATQYDLQPCDHRVGVQPILRYEVLLTGRNGRALSLVRETYLAQLLTAKHMSAVGP